MFSLKLMDRIAVSAMLLTAGAIPLAASAYAFGMGGEPAAKLTLGDGAERRFYTSGPLGTTTYRVDVSPAGQVLASTQVLKEDTFNGIRDGMAASDVFAQFGPPYRKTRFERTRTTAWDYHYRDAWGYTAEYSVIVDDADRVVGRFSAREGD
jgi:hypothetical protein